MPVRDTHGHALTTSSVAAEAYTRGVGRVLRLQPGAPEAVAEALAHDPTFALAHAALALLGHEQCAEVDVAARLRDARLHAARATERERSHVHAVARHVAGDSAPLVRHLEDWPTDALLLATAVPTIAFAGVSEVPADAWRIVERAAPAYGTDWWATGLLAFVRQEQHRFEEAMELSCRALAIEPSAGHAAHARAHAHYETGDHADGLGWMDSWLAGPGAGNDGRSHFVWHAALHELSMGDLDAVRARYEAQLLPAPALGCRALVDTGSLLHRWALTPGATDVPALDPVVAVVGRRTLEEPATPFVAMHAAVVLLATGDGAGLRRLAERSARHDHPTHREVVAPLARALAQMHAGRCSAAADALAALESCLWRLGGSDAQREVVEETRIAALLRAGRYDEARALLDRRLDRRPAERDRRWRATAVPRPSALA
ncbi:pyridine nucleotide-disulfide oxidoreductase [Nocardioides marmotae]|uniref:pyridine nucleotide-disulfide oxidoreductase n=1 Tax=Nocardioides marmotae TaxID=2663857 RepID=UPI0012B5EB6C|nr:pyridine nucleotide-disulfide oxidoreductase [Nocardioides marmotae]MBC9731744.1 pyridine nucleotide-disulfide oxidoreductase [Nocardioides marmotae]MTB82866.1 pyridine nucleotide-disulfide oxidoreductase [Nocardioides marmotae]